MESGRVEKRAATARTRGGFERKMPCSEAKGVSDTHTRTNTPRSGHTHPHTHIHTNTLGILCVFQMDYKMLGKLFSNVPPENFHLCRQRRGVTSQGWGRKGVAGCVGCQRQRLKHVLLARSHVVKNVFASVATSSRGQ